MKIREFAGRIRCTQRLGRLAWHSRDPSRNWPSWKVAEYLNISEQPVANYRFATVKKFTEGMRAVGLPGEVFPELAEGA